MGNGGLSALVSALRARVDRSVDTARSLTDETAHALRAVITPGGVRGVAVEAAWMATHALLYPWGVLAEQVRQDGPYGHYRTDELAPLQRGLVVSAIEAAGTPIVLVHGIVDNRSVFTLLASALRRRGFGVVHAVNYSVLTAVTSDVRTAATLLGSHIERVCERTGSDQVHVVGHSLGGLIARYYVQRQGGHQRVRTLVTLGTPHSGTLAAYLLPTRLARQLRPGSPLLSELTEPAPECRTRFVAVWSEMDQVVIPQRNARLVHPDLEVEEHQLRDAGHVSLPVDPRALRAVVTVLSQLDDPNRQPLGPVQTAFSNPATTESHDVPLTPSC